MKSILMAAASLLKKEDQLLFGTEELGYYGSVAYDDFISSADLAAQVGLTVGNWNGSLNDWLKFAYNGEILYVAKQPFKNNLNKNHLKTANIVSSETAKTVEIDGHIYRVMLISWPEWQDLMYRVHSSHPGGVEAWDSFTDAELGLGFCGSLVRDQITTNTSLNIGYNVITHNGPTTDSITATTRGWRPVLKRIG